MKEKDNIKLYANVEGQVESRGRSEGQYIIEQCRNNVVTNSVKYNNFLNMQMRRVSSCVFFLNRTSCKQYHTGHTEHV